MSDGAEGDADPRARLLLAPDSPLRESTRDLEDTALEPKAARRLKKHGFSDIRSLTGVSERDLLDFRQFGPKLVDLVVEGLALEAGLPQPTEEAGEAETAPSLFTVAQEFAAANAGRRLKVADFQLGLSESAGFEVSAARVRAVVQQLLGDESTPLIQVSKGAYCWSPDGVVPPPEMSPRDAQVVARRGEGRTLDEVGQEFGLTRERVRQILKKYGGPTAAEVRAGRRREQDEWEKAVTEGLRDALLNGGLQTAEELAERTGLDVALVQRLWPQDLRYLRVWDTRSEYQVWSDQACIEALQMAALFEFPLTTTAYAELIRVGQVSGPSVPGLANRFGSWSAACEAAGVEHGESRAVYESRWSDQDLLDFARKYLLDPRFTGSVGRYDEWKRDNAPDGPSQQTLRIRLGSWTDVKRMALANQEVDCEGG